MSWNINGLAMKTENGKVQELLLKFDVIGLNEIKTNERVSVPGFVTYKSGECDDNRGGTAVLVKQHLHQCVMSVDTSMKDQIWLRLSLLSDVILGFIYVPPSDSQYFNPNSFSFIQEKIKWCEEEGLGVMLMGDLNARFGASVRNIPVTAGIPDCYSYTYPVIPDPVEKISYNASILSTICIDQGLLVLNNLKSGNKYYESRLSYRAGNHWISELDVCILSHKVLTCVKDFDVSGESSLPSDHALISVCVHPSMVNREWLLRRAQLLGDHAVTYSPQNNHLRKPIKFSRINAEHFLGELSRNDISNNTDVDADIDALTGILYRCADRSILNPNPVGVDPALNRWERLMNDADDKRIWEAIDWRGEYKESSDENNAPSDEEFKAFFEDVYNPQDNQALNPNEFRTNVTIPVLDDPIQVTEVKTQINNMKPSKSCGPDGLSPGVLRLLPSQWILTISALFNAVFSSGCYPASWCQARMFTIFKRGDKRIPGNYRGINVINFLAKLFDLVYRYILYRYILIKYIYWF